MQSPCPSTVVLSGLSQAFILSINSPLYKSWWLVSASDLSTGCQAAAALSALAYPVKNYTNLQQCTGFHLFELPPHCWATSVTYGTYLKFLNPVKNFTYLKQWISFHLLQLCLLVVQPLLYHLEFICHLTPLHCKVLKSAAPFFCPMTDMCPPLTKSCQLVLHLRIRCKKIRLFLHRVC